MILLIEWISTWAEQIIVAVIIATIIEMILPSGNNKKYIKAVIGVYVLFTIISPILGKITNLDLDNINYEKYFNELDTSQTISQSLTTNNDKSVEEIYTSNLKQDMKSKLVEQGYIVDSISVSIELTDEANYGKINQLSITLYKKVDNTNIEEKKISNTISVNKIEEVKLKNTVTNNTSNKQEVKTSDKNEIKEYLSSVYQVNKKNIKINE